MKELNIKLEVFEGPMELLYYLINKNEIDIHNIPIVELTNQYISYIGNFETEDMESMSQFIIMAATLLEIKSYMLLPSVENEEELDNEPKKQLIEKLIEYKKFKNIVEVFKDNEVNGQKQLEKKPEHQVISKLSAEVYFDINEVLDGYNLQDLKTIFDDLMLRKELKTDKIRSNFKEIKKSNININDKIEFINMLLLNNRKIYFMDIFDVTTQKIEKIVTFVALLQMIKTSKVTIIQENFYDDILIIKV